MDDNLSRDPDQWLITDHPNRDRRAKNDREERKERRRRFLRCSAFLSAIVLPNEVGLLIHSISPPDAQERRRRGRKKGGDGGGGGGRSPVAVVCRRAKRREGSYMWVKKQERKFLVLAFCRQCFLSKNPRRHPESTRQTDNQPSNLPLTARWLTHCPPRSV